MSTLTITAIIVTFNTDASKLANLLQALRDISHVLVIDNSTTNAARLAVSTTTSRMGYQYFPMDGNKGVASAQNLGFSLAKTYRSDFVLLLDDDSLPHPDMTQRLIECHSVISKGRKGISIVCANAVESQFESSLRRHTGEPRYRYIKNMMSSGSLISSHILDVVGDMDSSLFIDYVDFEWGWRAISKGFSIAIAEDAYMSHRLGDGANQIFGLALRIPNPIRHYFQFRNAILLMKRKQVPFFWKLQRLLLAPAKLILLLLIQRPRLTRLIYSIRGVRDGVNGISGPSPI